MSVVAIISEYYRLPG